MYSTRIQLVNLPKWTFSWELHAFRFLDSNGKRQVAPACLASDIAQRLNDSENREDRVLIVNTERQARLHKINHPRVRFVFPDEETKVDEYFTQFFEALIGTNTESQ